MADPVFFSFSPDGFRLWHHKLSITVVALGSGYALRVEAVTPANGVAVTVAVGVVNDSERKISPWRRNTLMYGVRGRLFCYCPLSGDNAILHFAVSSHSGPVIVWPLTTISPEISFHAPILRRAEFSKALLLVPYKSISNSVALCDH